jgi:hypothetical protein
MARRHGLALCQCEGCLSTAGPGGKWISEYEQKAHRLNAQRDQSASSSPTPPLATNIPLTYDVSIDAIPLSPPSQDPSLAHMDVDIDLINDMSSRMFALTVTNDGSNIAAQPSPLWNGRAAVQDRLPATDTCPLLSAL